MFIHQLIPGDEDDITLLFLSLWISQLLRLSAACFIISHEYQWSSCDHMNIKQTASSRSSSSLGSLLQQEAVRGRSSTHDAPGETFTVTVVLQQLITVPVKVEVLTCSSAAPITPHLRTEWAESGKIASVFNEYINRPPVCPRSLRPPMMPCSAVFVQFKEKRRLQSPFSLQNRPQTVPPPSRPAACWEHTFILSFISRPRPLHKEKPSSSSSSSSSFLSRGRRAEGEDGVQSEHRRREEPSNQLSEGEGVFGGRLLTSGSAQRVLTTCCWTFNTNIQTNKPGVKISAPQTPDQTSLRDPPELNDL
ncbi:Hypothetical predicted protein [Xyrichtys novacula]|uniref:Uncharacterized protein n=1 Tax=Xyrichtys novacula TaxID=13765 RepID=A0AAV1FDU6_XYRNO|nr:Hypothetical predicted protein [Xyrichtys novacula]